MTTLSIKLDDNRARYLKKMSHYLSIERDEDLTLSDLVREALESSFPMPKQDNEQSEND